MRFDRLDAALEGRRGYAGNAYLFRGSQYTRFVWKLDREDFGYPISLSGWGLPTVFQSGVDAAINGQGAYADYAYFFKAGTYARYNWVTERVDLVDQPLSAWKLPSGFVSGIDAILEGQGRYAGTTYFFKLGQYARYRWASDVCEWPFDTAPAWHLPEDFNAGIDAAVNGGADFSGNAYLFKDTRYVRYDWNADRAGHGYPQPIQGNWKHGIALWADTDTALSVDRDARLREDGTTVSRLPYPHGTTRGQAGWDVGLHFNGLKDLATKLRYQPIALPGFVCGNWWQDCAPLGAGQISRLAINAHGDAGVVALWGKHNPRQLTVLSLATDLDMRADLEAIRDATEPDATVMFVGCLAGKSLGGTALLSGLSLLMPGRKVVAFTTVGFSHGARQARHGSGPVSSTEPGMRDTNEFIEAASEAEEEARYGPLWNDLVALPWAHEGSPHAKVALNGQIIRGADL